jgi:hypothetical protein
MASLVTHGVSPAVRDQVPRGGHQRAKSSVLKSFIHRRNDSDGAALPDSLSIPGIVPEHVTRDQLANPESPMSSYFSRPIDGALGELQQNQQDQSPRSRPGTRDDRTGRGTVERGRSPTKTAFGTLSFKSAAAKEAARLAKSRDPSPTKPKKTKSATNLAGLLSRPKSIKNLRKLATEDAIREAKDKENRTPPSSITMPDLTSLSTPAPPIYTQFCSQPGLGSTADLRGTREDEQDNTNIGGNFTGKTEKERPKSFHAYHASKNKSQPSTPSSPQRTPGGPRKASTADRSPSKTHRGPKVLTSFAGLGHKTSKSHLAELAEPRIDLKDIDTHLEAMLDRRNIPENQRYKMRNLNDTIKMEFIRQDWAESRAAKAQDRPRTTDSDTSLDAASPAVVNGSDRDETKPKRVRGKSFTLSRASKDPSSPTKKSKSDGTLGRHFRSKSSDSVTSDRSPSVATSSPSPSILSKIKLQHGPGDFVLYLRKVSKPELVEVGKLHKLRLLLRNETVAWTEDFIQQGGMKEIVGLLNRIMEVEWR